MKVHIEKKGDLLGETMGLEELIEKLKSDNPKERLVAAGKLKKLRDIRALDSFVKLLDDEDMLIRATAVIALGELNDSRVAIHLVRALNDNHYLVKKEATRYFTDVRDPVAIPGLVKVLIYSEGDSSSLAADALSKIGEPIISALTEVLKDTKHSAHITVAAIMFKIGKAAVPGFIEALEADNQLIVRMVISYLGRLHDIRAMPSLITFLDNPDSQTRLFSFGALNKIIENCDSLGDLLEIKTKLKEFLSADKKQLSYYSEVKDSVSALLVTVNAKENQLIAVDIRLDKKFRKPPVRRDNERYRMKCTVAIR